MATSNPLKADLLLVAVTLLAAFGWVFSREALAGMPPLQFIGTRFLIAGLVLAGFGWRSLTHLRLRHWFAAARVGLLFGVAIMLWVQGLFHGPHIGEGAFISSLSMILVPVMATIFFREHPQREVWIAIPIAIAGLACLSLNHGLRLSLGQLFYFSAALLFSVQFNLNAITVAKVPALPLTAIQLIVVSLIALPTSLALEDWPAQLSTSTWGWLLASALIATSLRFFLLTYAQGFASASHAALLMILEPVWTALLGFLWYRESMTSLQFSGCLLIFTALLITRWRSLRHALRPI
ncbi:Predicted permease [gamma proteobacterium HdN1]|nr:Predicted permease [gamma proteobacterium HdN1]